MSQLVNVVRGGVLRAFGVMLSALVGVSAVIAGPGAVTPASASVSWAGASFCASFPNSKALTGAPFNGVAACGGNWTGGTVQYNGAIFEEAAKTYNTWQCTELAARWFYAETGIAQPLVNYGENVAAKFHAAHPNYAVYPSSGGTATFSSTIQPGDIISMWGPSSSDPYGHVAVVTAVNVTGGQGSIRLLDENDSSSGVAYINVSNGQMSFGTKGRYYYYNSFQWLSVTPTQPQPGPAPAPGPYHAGRQVAIDKHATGGVSGHKGPANSYATGPTHPANSAIWIVCYVNGQSIKGPYDTTTIWDLSDDGYYYTDAWLYTGTNGPAVPRCALKNVTVDKHATGGVSGHKGPGNSYAAGPTHAVNTGVTIACYVNGQSIKGPYDTTTIWDLATDGYYYTDAWLYTGTNGAAVPHC